MDKYTNAEAINWIKQTGLPAKHINKIVEGMKENEFDGNDLLEMQDAKEVKENFNIIPAMAKKLLTKINEVRPKKPTLESTLDDLINNAPQRANWNDNSSDISEDDFKQPNNNNNSNSNNNNNNNNNGNIFYDKFNITWINGTKSSMLGPYTKNTKFSRALKDLEDKEPWKYVGAKFLYGNGSIPSEKHEQTLQELNIGPSARSEVIITIYHDMIGGSKSNVKENNKRQFTKEIIKKYYKVLKPMLTIKDKDIISLEDHKALRAKMLCGHALSPESMFNYVDTTLRSRMQTKIFCPLPNCKKEWDFDICTIVACMSQKEYLKYKKVINSRLTPQLKSCPSCKTKVKQPKELKQLRLNCGKGCGDFCFACLNKWKSSSMSICGNKECATYITNKKLQECAVIYLRRKDEKNAEKISECKIYEYRACVYCLTLIRYTQSCKHMSCQSCGKSFCFSCLSKYDGSWKCKGAYDQCPYPGTNNIGYIAPRQTL